MESNFDHSINLISIVYRDGLEGVSFKAMHEKANKTLSNSLTLTPQNQSA